LCDEAGSGYALATPCPSEPVKSFRHNASQREEPGPHEADFYAEFADIGADFGPEFADISADFGSELTDLCPEFTDIRTNLSPDGTIVSAPLIPKRAVIGPKLSAEFAEVVEHDVAKVANVLPQTFDVLFDLPDGGVEPADVNGHITPLTSAKCWMRPLLPARIDQLWRIIV
jgi:hypothetical protein